MLLAVTNPFTGLFFKLTKDMVYSRGILFMSVGIGSIMFYSAVGLVMVLINCRKIQPAVNAVLGLINDILDMSKIENGDLELKEEAYTRKLKKMEKRACVLLSEITELV